MVKCANYTPNINAGQRRVLLYRASTPQNIEIFYFAYLDGKFMKYKHFCVPSICFGFFAFSIYKNTKIQLQEIFSPIEETLTTLKHIFS